jgi:DNA-binding MarR family transcriptional regulator
MSDNALRAALGNGDDDMARLLLRAFRAVTSHVEAHLRHLGHGDVRAGHAAVFTNLDPDGTRIVTLAQRADVSRQAMSLLVRELEESGYLVASPDPGDGRASLVRLSAKGEKFCALAAEIVLQVEAEWVELLGRGELTRLRHSLHRLAESATDD